MHANGTREIQIEALGVRLLLPGTAVRQPAPVHQYAIGGSPYGVIAVTFDYRPTRSSIDAQFMANLANAAEQNPAMTAPRPTRILRHWGAQQVEGLKLDMNIQGHPTTTWLALLPIGSGTIHLTVVGTIERTEELSATFAMILETMTTECQRPDTSRGHQTKSSRAVRRSFDGTGLHPA